MIETQEDKVLSQAPRQVVFTKYLPKDEAYDFEVPDLVSGKKIKFRVIGTGSE